MNHDNADQKERDEIVKGELKNELVGREKGRKRLPLNVQRDLHRWSDMGHVVTDWDFAELHGLSTQVGYISAQVIVQEHHQRKFRVKDQKEYDRCICCFNHIQRKQIPLCDNVKELRFLGPDFPLFYIFLKSVIVLLLLLVASYSVLQLAWAIQDNRGICISRDQEDERVKLQVECTSYMALFANTQRFISPSEKVLRISNFVVMLILLIYFRDNFRKIILYYDEQKSSYADFSLLITNLPHKEEINSDPKLAEKKKIGTIIRQFFNDKYIFKENEFRADGKFHPKKILLITQNHGLEHQLEHKQKKVKELIKINKEIRESKGEKEELLKRRREEVDSIEESSEKIREMTSRLKEQLDREDTDCSKAIISFQEEEQRVHILKYFTRATNEQKRRHFGQNGAQVDLVRAPEPNQIFWEHFNLQRSTAIKRRIISWVIFVIILGAATTIFYFIKSTESSIIEDMQREQKESGQQNKGAAIHRVRALIYCSIILIILFNKFVMAEVIHHLVQYQAHTTESQQSFSFTIKYSLGLFFTTAVMTIFVQGATTGNIYKEDYGVVQEQTIFFFFNAFVVPAIWLVNPWYIAKWIKRKLNYRSQDLTQAEANKLMDKPEYIIGKRYGQVLENVWFVYLYVCIIPAGSILILIGLGIFYWVDKYNLLRKSSVISSIDGQLVMRVLFLLQFILVIKPAGQIIFDNWLRNDWAEISVIEICIGFVYLILPTDQILEYMNKQKFSLNSETYDALKSNKNIIDYQFYHPITKIYELSKEYNSIRTVKGHRPQEIDIQQQAYDLHYLKNGQVFMEQSKLNNRLAIKHIIIRPLSHLQTNDQQSKHQQGAAASVEHINQNNYL